MFKNVEMRDKLWYYNNFQRHHLLLLPDFINVPLYWFPTPLNLEKSFFPKNKLPIVFLMTYLKICLSC